MSRFDYVQYDAKAAEKQASCKTAAQRLEAEIDALPHGRAKSLALTSLEETYMWIGKAIRDDQIARGAPAPLQEERKTS